MSKVAKHTTDHLIWTHWNYRVVDTEEGECLVLYEVYYNGKNKIVNFTELAREPLGTSFAHAWHTKSAKTEALRDLKGEMKLMALALKSPVLKLSKLKKINPLN
jgi:hypothetical protein